MDITEIQNITNHSHGREGEFCNPGSMWRGKPVAGFCFICGKPSTTDSGKSVHMLTSGELTSEDEHENSQGFFYIGSECAKKLPAELVHSSPV